MKRGAQRFFGFAVDFAGSDFFASFFFDDDDGCCTLSGWLTGARSTLRGGARPGLRSTEGVRSMLCVPLRVAGGLAGVISAFSRRPAAFTAHHQRVLEAFAEQAGIAMQNAQLFGQSERRARETRALLEAGRAVTASLDAGRTVRVIMEQALLEKVVGRSCEDPGEIPPRRA